MVSGRALKRQTERMFSAAAAARAAKSSLSPRRENSLTIMIPKKNRINREDFGKLLKNGKFINSGTFSVRYLRNSLNLSHFSVVVAKKVAPKAVSRNKIRRRIYSILNEWQKTAKNPYFMAFFAKKGAEGATFAETEAEIIKILKNVEK